MRVLIVGGTQFMGRDTVLRLAEAGHDVSILHRRAEHDLGPDIGNLQTDRADLDRVARLLREHDFEAVLDFVYDWQHGTTPQQVEGMARACTDALRRYVFISSIGAYAGGTDLDEDAPLVPDDFPNPYGAHKAGTERMLFRMHRESGFPATTFRPPFVYGPRQPFYREQFFWDRMRDERPIILPDGGDTPMQWAYAPDIAAACARSIEIDAAIGEAFNVGHEDAITQRAFVEALARVAGTAPRLIAIPRTTIIEAGGQLVGDNLYFGEYLDLPPITTQIDKARRILGFVPTPFEAALGVTRDWYLTQPRRPIDYSFEDRLLAVA
jgi:nucleoside-diphosphate-sugar epimerase